MNAFRESDVLRLLVARNVEAHVVEGVADRDDCAVLALRAGHDVCVTTDFVRGTGFTLHRLGHLGFEDLGWYVVAANVSDLAAMGAEPLGYLSVVRYAPERTLDEVAAILSGIDLACSQLKCPLVGGDSGSYAADVLSGTALGSVQRDQRLSRSTFAPGYGVYVSGAIGGAAAALAAATGDIAASAPEAFASALERWRRPWPRVLLGMALARIGAPIAAMDVSDGLTASLQQLGRITGHGFEIDAAALPLDGCVRPIAERLKLDPVYLACSASVDFELLVGAHPADHEAVMAAAAISETPLTRIGVCTEEPNLLIRLATGRLDAMPGSPWDHQTADVAEIFAAR